jgi:hypothetical protein
MVSSATEEKAQVIAEASTWLFCNQLPIPTTDHKDKPKVPNGICFPFSGFWIISRRVGIDNRFKRQASPSRTPRNILFLTDLRIKPGPIGE